MRRSHESRGLGAASRRWAIVLAPLSCGLVLAACSSSPPSHTGSLPPHTPPSTARTTAPAHPTTSSPATTLPALPTAGPLQLGAQVVVPLGADQVAATEGPDGAVFVAAQSPDSAAPAVVWVVDGNGPATIAEHVNSGVAALAADASNLYVASYASVTSFDRVSGNQVGQWNLPHIDTANSSNDDLVSMTAAAGRVFVVITQGNTQSVYRIAPGSGAAPRLIARGISAVVGPDGSVFYERSDDRLVEVHRSGATTAGPLLADAPNGLGGGVQFLTVVANGVLWVSEPAGQGLDARYSRYDGTTLHLLGTYDGTTTQQPVGTAAGTLVLSFPDGPVECGGSPPTSTPAASCLSRVTSGGTLMDAIGVGAGFVVLGPDPVVVADNPTSTELVVERVT